MKTTPYTISLILLFISLMLRPGGLHAQVSTGQFMLKGTVCDSVVHHRLPFVTIEMKGNKGEIIRSATTKEDGTFAISLPPSSYQIKITAAGYASKTSFIDLQEDYDMGLINIRQQLTTLKEVAITSTRPLISRKADRIIYDLQADPESKSNSVLSMLHKIPYLSLDGSENILLKGNSSFSVLINGKRAVSVENNLNAVLKSMPASTIERIEVITIPPSKYDGEGLAGIVNIITVKKINDGYNGSLNVNGSFPAGGPGTGASFTAKNGRFVMTAYGGAGIVYNPQANYSSIRKGSGTNVISLLQQGMSKSTLKTAYFGTEMSFEIDTLHLISGQFNMNGSSTNSLRTQISDLTEKDISIQAYHLMDDHDGKSHGLDAAINYQLGFKDHKNRLLTFSYQFSDNRNNRQNKITITDPVGFFSPDYNQNDDQKFSEHTFQVDFVTPVKKINIETGIKGILRNSDSDFGYSIFDSPNSLPQPDPARSDQYTNEQLVLSAYNSYQLNLNSWNISAGLRLETTRIRANFISSNNLTDQDYVNLLPSIALANQLSDRSTLSFGFSQRIRRPGINRLNPYINRSNPNFESTGNPNLRPVMINDVQAGYSRNTKLSFNIGLDYSFMKNLDLQVVDFDPETQITRTSFANTGKSSSLATNFSASYPIGEHYSLNLNGNAIYLWLQGMADGEIVTNNRLIYTLSLSNAFKFNRGWAANAALEIVSRNPTGLQGYSNSFTGTAFSVNKELIKNKLVFAAQVKNPFTKFRNNRMYTSGPDFNQLFTSADYYRSFGFSLNYKLGGLNNGVNKSKKSIRNNDLAN